MLQQLLLVEGCTSFSVCPSEGKHAKKNNACCDAKCTFVVGSVVVHVQDSEGWDHRREGGSVLEYIVEHSVCVVSRRNGEQENNVDNNKSAREHNRQEKEKRTGGNKCKLALEERDQGQRGSR